MLETAGQPALVYFGFEKNHRITEMNRPRIVAESDSGTEGFFDLNRLSLRSRKSRLDRVFRR